MNLLTWMFNASRRTRCDALRDELYQIAQPPVDLGDLASRLEAALAAQSDETVNDALKHRQAVLARVLSGAIEPLAQPGIEHVRAVERLAASLRLDDVAAEKVISPTLSRKLVFARLAAGEMPTHPAPSPMILQDAECLHIAIPGDLVEERVTDRRYIGGSRGTSVRVAKGVTVRMGASRGRVLVDRGLVPVASGSLCITNRRLAFAGDRKSFSLDWKKIVNIEADASALIAAPATGNARMVRFSQPLRDPDIMRALLDAAIRRAPD